MSKLNDTHRERESQLGTNVYFLNFTFILNYLCHGEKGQPRLVNNPRAKMFRSATISTQMLYGSMKTTQLNHLKEDLAQSQ